MAKIDHTNYSTTLKESTNTTVGRGGAGGADGNVYFDVANNRIHLLGVDEVPTVDFGGGPVTNPLSSSDGITMRALYNFENARRRLNETLRKYKRGTDGDYRFAGAFNFVNGVKLHSNDRNKIRDSGFKEYADTGDGQTDVDRIYHGVVSLAAIQSGTQAYYTLSTSTTESTLQSATWMNFVRLGPINETVQVYGSTSFGDTGAGSFDYTTRTLVVRVRSWQYNPGETTSIASGITEFSGFSAGYGVGETLNPNNAYTLADVFGGAQVSPWTGMSLERLASPTTQTGFNEADGNFRWRLNNSAGGTAAQCAAYLDALTLQDADIDAGTGTYNGKKGRVWYTRNASGKIVTSSISGEGLFIAGLSPAEKQNVVFTDDANATKTYPFYPSVVITVGANAVADTDAWFHVYYSDGAGAADFDTTGAVTVQDKNNVEVKGNIATSPFRSGNTLVFEYAYQSNSQAGLSANVDKVMVVEVEGDGGVAQALATFTVSNTATIAVSCIPPAETNA